MRTSEWVVLGYFAYLIASATVLRARPRAFHRVAGLGSVVALFIVVTAWIVPPPIAPVLRDWLPGAYLLTGYWATGLLYRGPVPAVEARLITADARVAAWLHPLLCRVPRFVSEIFELAYLLCYPLVPAGLAALYLTGQRSHADAFWVMVLTATFVAYGVLPWVGTRPPRALGSAHWMARQRLTMQQVNLKVLHRGSIHVNTFPSGHAASAWSTALFLTTVPGPAWLGFMACAAGIGVGAVAGRYHYLVDVAAGIATAFAVFLFLAQ